MCSKCHLSVCFHSCFCSLQSPGLHLQLWNRWLQYQRLFTLCLYSGILSQLDFCFFCFYFRLAHTQQFGLCTFPVAVVLAIPSFCSLNECGDMMMLFNLSRQQQSVQLVQSGWAVWVWVWVRVCGSASRKLCVNDGGE